MTNPAAGETVERGAAMAASKQMAVVAMLLAIGAVLRAFTPPLFGITPNFVIAMYCLAILLVRPGFGGALGIGLVGGALCMVLSKSPVPYLNLITEPIGALACVLIVRYLPELTLKRYAFKPIVATTVGTLASGTSYITLNFFVFLNMPFEAWQAAFLGVVIPVTLINAVLTQLLYAPSKRFLRA